MPKSDLRDTVWIRFNLYSDHKNMAYASTPSKSQKVKHCKINIKEFGTHNKDINGVENFIADMLSRLTPALNFQ